MITLSWPSLPPETAETCSSTWPHDLGPVWQSMHPVTLSELQLEKSWHTSVLLHQVHVVQPPTKRHLSEQPTMFVLSYSCSKFPLSLLSTSNLQALFSVMQNCVSLLSLGFLCPGKTKELHAGIRPKTRKETVESSIATTSFEQTVQIRDPRLTKETRLCG